MAGSHEGLLLDKICFLRYIRKTNKLLSHLKIII